MRKLNVFHADYGSVFWEKENKIIVSIHANDGNYREEYFNPIFKYFGIKVITHEKQPKWLTDELLEMEGIL